MMERLQAWATENPDEKVIHLRIVLAMCCLPFSSPQTMIVSQWTQCLQLVSEYLTSKDICHVRFQGDMSRDERERAVRKFKNKNEVKVLLMSLKCGGVGLVSRYSRSHVSLS